MNRRDPNISVERAARILATLLVTPDEHLEAYRAELLGPDSTVLVEHLRKARASSLTLSHALDANDLGRLATILEALERVAEPEPVAKPPASEETASIGDFSPLAGRELPFYPSAAAIQPESVADEVGREAESGETVALGEMSPLAALALGQSAASPAVDLSFEQYACLCAALRIHPERRDETLSSYGLTVDSHRELEQTWRQRLQARPELGQRFGALVQHYRAWMQLRSDS